MPPSPSMGSVGGGMSSQPSQPSQGSQDQGTSSLMSQPSGGEQMSDPKVIIATVFSKMTDLISALNTSFPGGEDKISEGMQSIGMGMSEKIQRMGTPEAPAPNIPA